MARQLRVFIAGISVHVIHRGNNRQTIFADDEDHAVFLSLLVPIFREHEIATHGYVLMKNHFHLQVTPGHKRSLPNGMKKLGVKYVRYFNRKHDRIGHLFAARAREILITDERYWLTCLRYIEQNPVRARIVSTPGEYRWSSHGANAWGEPCDWLTRHPLYLSLGQTDAACQAVYRAFVESPQSETELIPQRLDASAAP